MIATERKEIKNLDLSEGGGGVKEVVGRIVSRLREFATSQRYKVSPSRLTRVLLWAGRDDASEGRQKGRLDDVSLLVAHRPSVLFSQIQVVSLASPAPSCFLEQRQPLLLPTIWAKLDVCFRPFKFDASRHRDADVLYSLARSPSLSQAIPFYIPLFSSNPPNHFPSASTPQSPDPRDPSLPPAHHRKHLDLSFLPPQTITAEGEDRAQRAVRAAVKQLAVSVRSATGVECTEDEMEVEVDRNGEVKLVGLGDYEATTSPDLWRKFLAVSTWDDRALRRWRAETLKKMRRD